VDNFLALRLRFRTLDGLILRQNRDVGGNSVHAALASAAPDWLFAPALRFKFLVIDEGVMTVPTASAAH
jgi:hypothetical protein